MDFTVLACTLLIDRSATPVKLLCILRYDHNIGTIEIIIAHLISVLQLHDSTRPPGAAWHCHSKAFAQIIGRKECCASWSVIPRDIFLHCTPIFRLTVCLCRRCSMNSTSAAAPVLCLYLHCRRSGTVQSVGHPWFSPVIKLVCYHTRCIICHNCVNLLFSWSSFHTLTMMCLVLVLKSKRGTIDSLMSVCDLYFACPGLKC